MPETPPSPPGNPRTPPPSSTSSGFGGRLATYLFGVAIGLLVLGWFSAKKHAAMEKQSPTTPATENLQTTPADPTP